jgi:hypothetical protein
MKGYLLRCVVALWHIATIRTAASNGRYRGIADIVTTFGTRGSQVQILPLRPVIPLIFNVF